MKLLVALVSLGLAGVAPAHAQAQAPAIDDPEAIPVEELIVRARLPGPAWWRVTDGDTTVYVLGVPDALPKGLRWDQSVLKKRLKGAHTVITPPEIRVSARLRDLPGLYGAVRKASNDKAQISALGDLAPRLESAAARVGKDGEDYADQKPWLAGVRLAGRYREKVGLVGDQPEKAVRAAARKAKLKPQPAFVIERKAKDVARELLRDLPDAVGRDCLRAAIEEVEEGDAAVRATARAWAEGDVPEALAAPRANDRCLAAVPGSGDLKREAMARQADAIEAALKKPGHAVAVVGLRSLLAREGVLQRLKARGYVVRTPE